MAKTEELLEKLLQYRVNIVSDVVVISKVDQRGMYFPIQNMEEVIEFNSLLKETREVLKYFHEISGMYKDYMTICKGYEIPDRDNIKKVYIEDALLSQEKNILDDTKYSNSIKF